MAKIKCFPASIGFERGGEVFFLFSRYYFMVYKKPIFSSMMNKHRIAHKLYATFCLIETELILLERHDNQVIVNKFN